MELEALKQIVSKSKQNTKIEKKETFHVGTTHFDNIELGVKLAVAST
jgi:hypothetical protein